MKVKTYHCDCCPSYCELKKEGELPPQNICIEDGSSLDDDTSDLAGWYLVTDEIKAQ